MQGKCSCCRHGSPCTPDSPSQGVERSTRLPPAPECPLLSPRRASARCWGVGGGQGGRGSGRGERQPLVWGSGSAGNAGGSKQGFFIRLLPCEHKPFCCCASRSQQRPRTEFECCCRLGPKAIVNRAVKGPFVWGAKADMKPVTPPRAVGDQIRRGFVTSVPAAAEGLGGTWLHRAPAALVAFSAEQN